MHAMMRKSVVLTYADDKTRVSMEPLDSRLRGNDGKRKSMR